MSGSRIPRARAARQFQALLLFAAVVLYSPFSFAQQGGSPDLIDNVFLQSDLRQALSDVAAQAGVNIIADPSVQGVVSVTLEDATVEEALSLLLAGSDYGYARFRNYYLVYSADPTSESFTSVAETELVDVQYLDAELARSLLPPPLQQFVRADPASDRLVITAPPWLISRIQEDLLVIDRPASAEAIFIPLNYATAPTAVALLPESFRRFVEADAQRNVLSVSAPLAIRQVILDQIARLDRPRQPGNFDLPDVHRTTVVKLENAAAEGALALLPAELQAYVRADPASNMLAVSAPPSLRAGILADIAAIDVPRRHVMLDARVVILERLDLLDFGVDWQFPTITAGTAIGDGLSWPWELRIGYSPTREFTNALALTLNMLSANNEATVISSPQVLAQDGKEAEVRVTTEEYFQITSESVGFVSADLETIETGTILGITPQIGPNGDLTLTLAIEVSDVVARGEEGLPVVNRRTARSTIQIENGGTAAVAGLADTRALTDQDGIPGLRNTPILGRAFRTDGLRHQARQVAVFVTATIVDQDDPVFVSGRREAPPIAIIDEELYRSQLSAALGRR